MMPYHVTLLQPDGHGHILIFEEVARLFHHAFESLRVPTTLGRNVFKRDGVNLLFGCHWASRQMLEPMRGHCRITFFQTEQLSLERGMYPLKLRDLLPFADEIWDFSEQNVAFLKSQGFANVKHVPLGFHEKLCVIPKAPPIVDVLFYGQVSERRLAVLDPLSKRWRVEAYEQVYGADRDRLIGRSKIILNIHSPLYEGIMEQFRIHYLLNNGCFVLSESAPENPYDDAITAVPHARMVEACEHFLSNESERVEVARRGFEWFKERPMTEYLKRVL